MEVLARWHELSDGPSRFRDGVFTSTLPVSVIDAAAANLSILKSPTTLRLEDGTFYGWEGCHPAPAHAREVAPTCGTIPALPFLFPPLERSMREADYKYNLNAAGGLSFRLSLPFGTNHETERPCADGQFGNILKLYRDWKLSGDTEWLGPLWPRPNGASNTRGARTIPTVGIPSRRAFLGPAASHARTWIIGPIPG